MNGDIQRVAESLTDLYEIYTPEGVALWLRGRKKRLANRTPLEALRGGDVDGFCALVESLHDS